MNTEILSPRGLNPKHGSVGIAAFVSRFVMVFGILTTPFTTKAAEPVPAAPKPVVTITAFAWDVLTPDGDLLLNLKMKGKLESVQIAWRDRSLPLVYDEAGPLVFTQTQQRDGKAVEVPVARADIPEGVSRALLVFGRNPAKGPGELRYLVKVLDDSYTVFPGQSVRFLNYTQMELGGSLGGRTFSVAPGGDQVVPVGLPERNRLLPFKLARREETGGWQKLRSTGLPMTEGLRVLVFMITDHRHPGQPETVMMCDRAEPEPAVPTPPGP